VVAEKEAVVKSKGIGVEASKVIEVEGPIKVEDKDKDHIEEGSEVEEEALEAEVVAEGMGSIRGNHH
jgi:hypothetical protein